MAQNAFLDVYGISHFLIAFFEGGEDENVHNDLRHGKLIKAVWHGKLRTSRTFTNYIPLIAFFERGG